jgi:hypothetical protein
MTSLLPAGAWFPWISGHGGNLAGCYLEGQQVIQQEIETINPQTRKRQLA